MSERLEKKGGVRGLGMNNREGGGRGGGWEGGGWEGGGGKGGRCHG